ncbi:MAG: 3-isopropylmalate dehydratase small subunit, partial [Planctomycetaceae bacterium]|nr:3-isopropylmalate dehydratase small subunit [Planctomycetaceae bacterium]
MNPFRNGEYRYISLPSANIDTDQIIPARFLTTTSRAGLGRALFHDWRFDSKGNTNPNCILNNANGADAIVAGPNFGCGSSREHAAWALLDFGIRVVISTKIADIFRGNALKNGILPIELPKAVVEQLLTRPIGTFHVDLRENRVVVGGERHTFTIEPFARTCLLEGMDELDFLLRHEVEITRYERQQGFVCHPGESRDP